MKIFACLAALVLSLSSTFAGEPLKFSGYGFQIEALEPKPGPLAGQIVALYLPPQAGFSANLTVMIQPYAGTIQEYIALSKGQFSSIKAKVVTEKVTGDSEWLVEYTGELQGTAFHWYSRAVRTSGKVYLVTATERDPNWAQSGAILQKSVDSFRLQ